MAPGSSENNPRSARSLAGISIRFKLVAVVVVALALSFLAHLYFGASLISADKTSYLYEFTASETRASAEEFESQVAAILRTARVAAALGDIAKTDGARFARAVRESSAGVTVDRFALLRVVNSQEFEILNDLVAETTPTADGVAHSLRELGWTPAALRDAEISSARSGPAGLALAGFIAESGGKTGAGQLAFFCRLRLDLLAPGDSSGSYSLYLLDAAGKPLNSRNSAELRATDEQWRSLAAEIPRRIGERGARGWRVGDRELIIGYRRLTGGLLIVSAIPSEVAFQAVRSLLFRSLLTGLGILLLTTGLAMALARALTSRLSRLSQATRQIAAGDFSVRIAADGRTRDEISGLSAAFNIMAQRISELIVAAAEKLRMEHELDTGRAYQGELIPTQPFAAGAVRIAGTYFPATECAGDWWRYFPLRNQVLLVISDATGHGVRAALTSSLLQGACLAWVQRHLVGVAVDEIPAALTDLLRTVNQCALASGGEGSSTATLMAILIDLTTGDTTLANAGHPTAYLVDSREFSRDVRGSVFDHTLAFGGARASSLIGQGESLQISIEKFSIAAHNALLLYSDGMFDDRASDGLRLRKTAVLDSVTGALDAGGADAVTLNHGLARIVRDFFTGEEGTTNLDDVTFVVVTTCTTDSEV